LISENDFNNDGNYIQSGDIIIYDKKLGNIVNFDRQTVNIKLNNGLELTNVSINNIRKASIINQIIDEAKWINKI